MEVNIVIPHYNRDELTDRLVSSLIDCCKDIPHILVMDDFSIKPYENKKVTVARNPENLGFLKTCNLGLQLSSGGIIVLISNDVLVTGDFIPQLTKVIKDSPLALVGNRLISFNSGWNMFNGKIYPFLEGWFLAATAEVWDELGGFDEQYSPNDYEDTDLSTTAYSMKFPVISLETPYLKHIGAQTLGYNPEREAITKVNREKFAQKWTSTSKNAEGK